MTTLLAQEPTPEAFDAAAASLRYKTAYLATQVRFARTLEAMAARPLLLAVALQR